MIERIQRNIHRVNVGKSQKFLLLSDLHWDNPKCERGLLTRHLKQAQERGAKVIINGDFFCMMQGKYDPRRSKKDILPEHNKANYIDAVIEDAVKWWTPYADMILLIGYGNHECYHPDTEVLTDKGWVNITEVTTEDMVAAFDSKHIYFEKPNAVVSKQADALYTIEGSYTKQIVSSKHAVMLNDMSKINAEDLYFAYNEKSFKELDLPHGRTLNASHSSLDASMIELLTAVVMDATIIKNSRYLQGSKKVRIQFKLSKQNKIEYIKNLLDRNQIAYTFKECKMTGLNKLQPYYIRVYGEQARMINGLLNGEKVLPKEFGQLTGDSFLAMMTALKNTDGHVVSESLEWTSTEKSNVDVIHSACVLNGWHFNSKTSQTRSGFDNGKTQYVVRITKSIVKNKTLSITKQDYDGLVHCLNMPSGCFVTRIDGKVSFSGNTAIIKNLETDPLQRFVDLLNATAGTNVQVGGYGGVLDFKMEHNKMRTSFAMKYYHGFGGGGAVTKGVIQDQRMISMMEGYDVIWMGHVHEIYHHVNVVEAYDSHQKKLNLKEVHQIRTGAYKEEYGDGYGGYHIEKGRPPKPMGGYWMSIEMVNAAADGGREIKRYVEFTKTDS
jgi:hypothetical protein